MGHYLTGRCRSSLFITFVFLTAVLTACTPHNEAPFRVGATLWPGYEPLHLAESQGYFDSQTIRLVDSTSPHGSIQGLRNGDLDGVALTLDEVLLLVDQGIDLNVVLVFDFSNGGDAIVGRKGIENIAALKGKHVGLESNALGTYLLSRALEMNGLNLQDVTKHYMKVSTHRQALKAGEVDAVVSFEPVRSQLMADGANELFSSKDIPNEIVDVLAVRREYTEQYPQRINELIAGWYRALEYFSAHPLEASRVMAERLQQSPAEFEMSLAGIKLPSRADTYAMMRDGSLASSAERLARTMHSQGIMSSIPNTRALINSRYLK